MTSTTTFTQHDWPAPDGETFSYSHWETDLPVRAVMVAVHGLSGAALDFEPLGAHLAQWGVVTFALELRGQGNDPVESRRGDLIQIEDWFADLRAFFALVRVRHPHAPIYYYGESMGSALLTRFLAQAAAIDQPAGLILAVPVIEIPNRPSWWQELMFRFFLMSASTYRINVAKYVDRTDQDAWVTRDEAHREWIKTAPHRLTCFTVRFFHSLRTLITGCFDAAPKITVPVLVLYAANDIYIKPARVEAFFAQLGSREKELQFFPESYHLLLHDFDKAQALARIETWLLARIASTSPLPSAAEKSFPA